MPTLEQIKKTLHLYSSTRPPSDPAPTYTDKEGNTYLITHRTTLFQKENSSGGKQFWQGRILVGRNKYDYDPERNEVFTQSDSWSVNKAGKESKHVYSDPKIVYPKNVGRSNETTPIAQASSDIVSDAEKKRDKLYWPANEPKPEFLTMPMTAKTFAVKTLEGIQIRDAGKIKYPAAVQPKLDGIRLFWDGVKGWTRYLNISIPEVVAHLQAASDFIPKHIILDGEIMLPPDRFTFQETTSAYGAFDPERSPLLELHVFDLYDMLNPGMTFGERNRLARDLVLSQPLNGPFKLVPTGTVEEQDDVFVLHDSYVREGHEGIMVRNWKGKYKATTTRSSDLQKMKAFFDEEFLIVAYKEGEGKNQGTPIWLVQVDDNTTAEVPMDGPYPYLRRLWDSRDQIVQDKEMVTVRYQGKTDEGSLRFPRGQAIRDYE